MAEENNIKWLDLFKKVIKPGCSFGDYIEFMTMVNPDSNNLDVKSRQAVTVLSEKKDVAFQETEKGFVTLPSLLESSEAQKVLLDSFEEAEKNLLSSIPELEPGNTYEIGNLKRKFLLGIRNDIRYISHHTAEKVFRRQGELNRKYADERRIQKEFHEYVEREIPRMCDLLMNKAVREFDNVYAGSVILFLDKWRELQIGQLSKQLEAMIPDTDYYSVYGGKSTLQKISPKQGKEQAHTLAIQIVDIIYDARKEIFQKTRTQPLGGNIGNIIKGINKRYKDVFKRDINSNLMTSQMECADWAEILFNNLQEFIANWFMDNTNSFSIEWVRKPPILGEAIGMMWNIGEHNLIRIRAGTAALQEVYIDPWPSGGKEIMRDAHNFLNNGYDVMRKNGKTQKYPYRQSNPDVRNNRSTYFFGPSESRTQKYPLRDRNKPILGR